MSQSGLRNSAPKRVLVIRIGRLGDTILATPVIQALHQVYGRDTAIDFAAGPGACARVLSLDQRVNLVFPVVHRRLPWYVNRSKRNLSRHSRGRPYDLVFNLESGRECDDFIRFVKAREFHGRPLTKVGHEFGRHCVDTEKSIYAPVLGREVTERAVPSLQLSSDVKNVPAEIPGDYIVLNPGFSGVQRKGYRSHRRWPNAHWIALIRTIVDSGRNVAINGSKSEKICFESLLEQPGVYSLFGASLEELIAAMVGAHGLISVDTGSMHLAAALGIPVLALFGPTDSHLTGPYRGNAISKVISAQVDCRPCVKTAMQKQCGFNRCMQEISPESVFEAFERMMWDIPKPLDSPHRNQTTER